MTALRTNECEHSCRRWPSASTRSHRDALELRLPPDGV
jgi:hypothetical protein